MATVAGVMTAGRSSLSGLFLEIDRLSPWRAQGYVVEAAPLMQSFAWRPIPLWRVFTTSLFLCLLALPACISFAAVRKGAGVRLVLLWALVSLAATFGQVRFAYYLAIGVALLAGLGGDLDPELVGAGPQARQRNIPRRSRAGCVARGCLANWRGRSVGIGHGAARPAFPREASSGAKPLTSDRFDALQWMRTNTPEPFGDGKADYSHGEFLSPHSMACWPGGTSAIG